MKKMISLLAILLVLTTIILPASAASPRLADEAGLLSGPECTAIEKQLDALSGQYGVDVVIVTAETTGSKTPMEYADDYFDYNDYDEIIISVCVIISRNSWTFSLCKFHTAFLFFNALSS